jgi:hypothetical protein
MEEIMATVQENFNMRGVHYVEIHFQGAVIEAKSMEAKQEAAA